DVLFDHFPAADFHRDLVSESVLFEGAVHQAPGAQVARRQDERISADVFQGKFFLLAGEGMSEAGDHNRFVGDHRMKFDVGRDVRERSDGEIDQSGAEPFEAFDAGDIVEAQLNFGVSLAEDFDEFGQDVENGGPAGGNLNAALVDFGAA